MGRESLIGQSVQPPGTSVTLDRGIETISVERFEPRAKPCQLTRWQLFDSLLKVFSGSHVSNITRATRSEKAFRKTSNA